MQNSAGLNSLKIQETRALNILFVVLVGMLSVVLGGGCGKQETSDSSPRVTVEVRAATIQRGQIEETIEATGSTFIQRDVQLRSSINGILVDFKYFNGDKIPKGTVIARIRSKEAAAALQGAEVLMQSAQTDQQREEAQKALALAERSSNTVSLTAPFEGILSNKQKNEQEVIAEGEQIATLVDPSSIVFAADVPSSLLSRIKIGQRAHIRFTGSSPVEGTVNRIEPLVNATDQTGKVKILLAPSSDILKGSLFGEASIVTGEKRDALLVPRSALLVDDENNSTSIMVAGADSLAHQVNVRVTWKSDSMAAISGKSITPSTSVIVEGNYGLPDSTKIRVKN